MPEMPASRSEARAGAPGTDNWEEHWERYSDSAGDNPAQAYRRRLVLEHLGAAPDRILDIGCGQGDLVRDIAERFPGAELAGVEWSGAGIAVAQKKVPRARFQQRDLLAPAPPPGELAGWATAAVCSEVLEHVDDPVLLLRHVRDYMAPGSTLVVTVPGGPMSAFDRHIGHRAHYRPDQLRDVLERSGFAVQRLLQAGWPFFNLYRLLVVVRGRKLIDEVARDGDGSSSPLARLAMRGFRTLFRWNRETSRWGWQLVAVATAP